MSQVTGMEMAEAGGTPAADRSLIVEPLIVGLFREAVLPERVQQRVLGPMILERASHRIAYQGSGTLSPVAILGAVVSGDDTNEPLAAPSSISDYRPAPTSEPSNNIRLPRLGLVFVSLALLAASCSTSTPTVTNVAPSSTTTTVGVAESPDDTGGDRTIAKLQSAVDELIEANSYRFEVTVSIATQDSIVEVELEGWVDGPDRELVLRTDSGEVTTRVTDGLATVERQGETIEVPLESASTAPSLHVLTAITDITWAPGNTIQGKLSAVALGELGFDVIGAATVTATLRHGSLTRYTLTADDEAWTIRTNFTDLK
jgi:hypothetical protein